MPAKGKRRKNQIIDTAKMMFLDKGYQSTHIGQVCDELKIARGTVYQYFGNKREIIYSILENVEDQIDDIFDPDDLNAYLAGNPDKAAVTDHMTNRITECIKTIINEPIIIKLIYKEIQGLDQEVIQRVDKFIEYICKTIYRDMESCKAKNMYRKELDSSIASIMIVGSVQLLLHEFMKKEKDVLDKNVIKNIVDISLRGII
jgi:AcrR family transcriptional regulator